MQEITVSSESELLDLVGRKLDISGRVNMISVAQASPLQGYKIWLTPRIEYGQDSRYEARVSKETEHCIDFPWRGRSWSADDAQTAFMVAALAIVDVDISIDCTRSGWSLVQT